MLDDNYVNVITMDDGRTAYLDADGRPHRLDGPAWEWPDGKYEWFLHGRMHRVGGPQSHYPDNDEKFPIYEWRQHGKLHREDGPALIWKDGRTAYALHNVVFDPIDGVLNWQWLHDNAVQFPISKENSLLIQLSLADSDGLTVYE